MADINLDETLTAKLEALGVRAKDDLSLVDDADLVRWGLSTIERRRFFKHVRQALGDASVEAITPPSALTLPGASSGKAGGARARRPAPTVGPARLDELLGRGSAEYQVPRLAERLLAATGPIDVEELATRLGRTAPALAQGYQSGEWPMFVEACVRGYMRLSVEDGLLPGDRPVVSIQSTVLFSCSEEVVADTACWVRVVTCLATPRQVAALAALCRASREVADGRVVWSRLLMRWYPKATLLNPDWVAHSDLEKRLELALDNDYALAALTRRLEADTPVDIGDLMRALPQSTTPKALVKFMSGHPENFRQSADGTSFCVCRAPDDLKNCADWKPVNPFLAPPLPRGGGAMVNGAGAGPKDGPAPPPAPCSRPAGLRDMERSEIVDANTAASLPAADAPCQQLDPKVAFRLYHTGLLTQRSTESKRGRLEAWEYYTESNSKCVMAPGDLLDLAESRTHAIRSNDPAVVHELVAQTIEGMIYKVPFGFWNRRSRILSQALNASQLRVGREQRKKYERKLIEFMEWVKKERGFGHYQCAACGGRWKSGFSYEEITQQCLQCGTWQRPFRIQDLETVTDREARERGETPPNANSRDNSTQSLNALALAPGVNFSPPMLEHGRGAQKRQYFGSNGRDVSFDAKRPWMAEASEQRRPSGVPFMDRREPPRTEGQRWPREAPRPRRPPDFGPNQGPGSGRYCAPLPQASSAWAPLGGSVRPRMQLDTSAATRMIQHHTPPPPSPVGGVIHTPEVAPNDWVLDPDVVASLGLSVEEARALGLGAGANGTVGHSFDQPPKVEEGVVKTEVKTESGGHSAGRYVAGRGGFFANRAGSSGSGNFRLGPVTDASGDVSGSNGASSSSAGFAVKTEVQESKVVQQGQKAAAADASDQAAIDNLEGAFRSCVPSQPSMEFAPAPHSQDADMGASVVHEVAAATETAGVASAGSNLTAVKMEVVEAASSVPPASSVLKPTFVREEKRKLCEEEPQRPRSHEREEPGRKTVATGDNAAKATSLREAAEDDAKANARAQVAASSSEMLIEAVNGVLVFLDWSTEGARVLAPQPSDAAYVTSDAVVWDLVRRMSAEVDALEACEESLVLAWRRAPKSSEEAAAYAEAREYLLPERDELAGDEAWRRALLIELASDLMTTRMFFKRGFSLPALSAPAEESAIEGEVCENLVAVASALDSLETSRLAEKIMGDLETAAGVSDTIAQATDRPLAERLNFVAAAADPLLADSTAAAPNGPALNGSWTLLQEMCIREVALMLRQEYSVRRQILLRRLDVTVQAVTVSERALDLSGQRRVADVLSRMWSGWRRGADEAPPLSEWSALAASTTLVQQALSGRISGPTSCVRSAVKDVRIGSVPDRGGIPDGYSRGADGSRPARDQERPQTSDGAAASSATTNETGSAASQMAAATAISCGEAERKPFVGAKPRQGAPTAASGARSTNKELLNSSRQQQRKEREQGGVQKTYYADLGELRELELGADMIELGADFDQAPS